MKRSLLYATSLLAIVGTMSSCAGKDKAAEADSQMDTTVVSAPEAQAEETETASDSIVPEAAQTTSAGLKMSMFATSFKEEGFKKGYTSKEDTKVVAALKKEGFEVSSKKVKVTQEICGQDETWTQTSYTCVKQTPDGETTVMLSPATDDIFLRGTITFASQDDLQEFVKSAQSLGYKIDKNGYYGLSGKYYVNPSDCYWNGLNFVVNGNKVSLIGIFEC